MQQALPPTAGSGDLSDDEILVRLLALNLERAAAQGNGEPAVSDNSDEDNA